MPVCLNFVCLQVHSAGAIRDSDQSIAHSLIPNLLAGLRCAPLSPTHCAAAQPYDDSGNNAPWWAGVNIVAAALSCPADMHYAILDMTVACYTAYRMER